MRKKTALRMRSLVELYGRYEGGKKSFCEKHGLSISCLDYWRRKLSESRQEDSSSGFIPLKVEQTGLSGQIELYYPNGTRVVLPIESPLEVLQSLLSISPGGCCR